MKNKRTIMIIDDDRDDIYFFIKAVKKLNEEYECFAVESGVKALEKLGCLDKLPDFIFLDLNMPRMNGKSCIEQLKKNSKLQNIPVIIYSTSSSKEEADALNQLGAAYYLVKPLDVMTLPALIQNALLSAEQKITV